MFLHGQPSIRTTPRTNLVEDLVALFLPRDEPRDVLIVGTGPLGRHTASEIGRRASRRVAIHFLSFPGEARQGDLPGGLLGTSDDLSRVLGERPFHEVYVAGNLRWQGDAMQAVVRTCELHGTPFALPASQLRLGRARPIGALADGYVHYMNAWHKPYQTAIKRAFDIVVAGALLVVLSPLLLLAAVLIKLDSPGPVLFRQQRAGLWGRPFAMLKFRSMVEGAEARRADLGDRNEQSGPVFKIRKDPRVTRVGRILRRFSVDELPQLINVLWGEMAIVGPRPPLRSEVAKYEPWQRRRLSVRPGLTCLWQVSGRNEIPFEEWMYLDLRYIDHWCFADDLKLLVRTIPAVLSGRGAS